MPKKVYIKTFGCQMNEKDSEKILTLLYPDYLPTSDYKEADLIIVNTCSVREKPEHKVFSETGRYKHLKKKKPVIIGIVGCVAQQKGEEILEKYPYVDFVLGTQSFYKIKEILEEVKKGKRIALTELREDFEFPFVSPCKAFFINRVKAYVNIMQGCDNFCTYCIVPYVRGREISYPPEHILKEVEVLASFGVKEIMLLGQNVNSYGKKNRNYPDFPELLRMVSQVDGILRIRFTTSHPKDLSEKLMQEIANNPKVCKHLHLPLQAGSNKILKRMNRKYTREEYLEKVERLRELCPEISFTTDIIVGFPGETEKDFWETVEMLEKVRFQEIYSFKYSDRPFTAASRFTDKIPEEEKEKRLEIVHKVQEKITREIYQKYIGKRVEILVEGKSKKRENWTGRTTTNIIVNFESPLKEDLTGKLVWVKITEAGKHSLKGIHLLPSCQEYQGPDSAQAL